MKLPANKRLCERFNSTIIQMLAKTLERCGHGWDRHLPYVVYGGPEVHTSSIRNSNKPSSIRGYAFAIQTAFDYSNKSSTIRTSLRRFEPSTIRTSLRRFEPSTIQTSLQRFKQAFGDSMEPSTIRADAFAKTSSKSRGRCA